MPLSKISINQTNLSNDLTNALKSNYDTAYSNTHTHNNKTALDSVSGINTGDETLSTITTKLGYTPANILLSNITQSNALTNLGFAGQSLAANGYYKLPNGLILQWGSITSGNGTSSFNLTFPITFSNTCLSFVGVVEDSSGDTNKLVLKVKNKSASDITLVSVYGNSGADGYSSAVPWLWVAIGY